MIEDQHDGRQAMLEMLGDMRCVIPNRDLPTPAELAAVLGYAIMAQLRSERLPTADHLLGAAASLQACAEALRLRAAAMRPAIAAEPTADGERDLLADHFQAECERMNEAERERLATEEHSPTLVSPPPVADAAEHAARWAVEHAAGLAVGVDEALEARVRAMVSPAPLTPEERERIAASAQESRMLGALIQRHTRDASGAPLYRCAVSTCPGYPYRASDIAHPCIEPPDSLGWGPRESSR